MTKNVTVYGLHSAQYHIPDGFRDNPTQEKWNQPILHVSFSHKIIRPYSSLRHTHHTWLLVAALVSLFFCVTKNWRALYYMIFSYICSYMASLPSQSLQYHTPSGLRDRPIHEKWNHCFSHWLFSHFIIRPNFFLWHMHTISGFPSLAAFNIHGKMNTWLLYTYLYWQHL